ncbi:hypothetical protein QZH41_007318 [Actinostola sp. cb2023]|nr:hypothetical protein QZH41_007318 [Actinostola sp. cb2023]
MSAEGQNLQAKYQKIAAEYAKAKLRKTEDELRTSSMNAEKRVEYCLTTRNLSIVVCVIVVLSTNHFCGYLHGNAAVLRAVEHSFTSFYKELKTDSLITLIVKFMNNNLDFLTSKSVLRTRGASTATEADPSHESVPYHLSVHNHHVLSTSTESSDTLSEQITLNQEKLTQLEQRKEHWMLECQLLQVKYEKECNKVQSLQNDLDKMKARMSGELCRSLYKRIRQSEKDRGGMSTKLQTANAKVKQIEDELDVTKRNYETQLSMMSEHLCGMNEKLTIQQDEIESLKTSGRTKKGKK